MGRSASTGGCETAVASPNHRDVGACYLLPRWHEMTSNQHYALDSIVLLERAPTMVLVKRKTPDFDFVRRVKNKKVVDSHDLVETWKVREMKSALHR